MERHWSYCFQDLEADSGQDALAMVNHRHFEPGSARTQNWDPGYEETVLKEAAEEMNELDAAMKEVRLRSKYRTIFVCYICLISTSDTVSYGAIKT